MLTTTKSIHTEKQRETMGWVEKVKRIEVKGTRQDSDVAAMV